jgi:hypothetical protein
MITIEGEREEELTVRVLDENSSTISAYQQGLLPECVTVEQNALGSD